MSARAPLAPMSDDHASSTPILDGISVLVLGIMMIATSFLTGVLFTWVSYHGLVAIGVSAEMAHSLRHILVTVGMMAAFYLLMKPFIRYVARVAARSPRVMILKE